ncbi:MAG: SRPBCC domain-containing protein [Bacillota bacterium]|nr:MAG: hypothetical protein DIU70_12435 [Bacillota bacterium]
MSLVVARFVEVQGSARQLWQALTDPWQLTAWFCDEADVNLESGLYRCAGPHLPPEARVERLLAWEPERLLTFAWTAEGDETVTFRLRPAGTVTRLEVTHLRHRDDAPPNWRILTDCLWAYYTVLLKQWVETGRTGFRLPFDPNPPSVIRFQLRCPVAPEEVFAALTRPDRLEKWIANRAQVEPWAGGRYDLGWGAHGEDGPGHITRWEEGRLLGYTWFESGRQTEVLWRIRPDAEGAVVELEHGDFGDQVATCLGCRLGWADWLNVLWLHLLGRPASRTWRGVVPAASVPPEG